MMSILCCHVKATGKEFPICLRHPGDLATIANLLQHRIPNPSLPTGFDMHASLSHNS